MNNTITLSQLITRLASATGVDNNTARKFLRALFTTIEDSLASGHGVTVKGIGTFRPINGDIAGSETMVSYTPDKELAAEINRPFEMFSAVELADGVEFNEPEKEKTDNPTPAVVESESTEESINTTPTEIPVEEEPVEEQSEELPTRTLLWPEEEEATDRTDDTLKDGTTPERQDEPILSAEDEESESAPGKRNLLWLWIALIFIAIVAGAYFAAVYTTPVKPAATEAESTDSIAAEAVIEEVTVDEIATPHDVNTQEPAITPQPTEGIEQAESKRADTARQPVYDTVDVSLIRLAKKHYGEASFWVYIFEANSSTISNPNRISPGQKVLIPDASTFPGKTKSEKVELAKAKQSELLARFK